MTTATLAPSSINRPLQAPGRAVSVIAQLQDAVCALPTRTLLKGIAGATTIADLASAHIIDGRTLAVVARKDCHIQPIAAMITERLLGATVTVIGSAIIVCVP